MKLVFWISAAAMGYAYLGYAGWLWLRSRFGVHPVQRAAITPRVSVVMVVRNEERVLRQKISNLLDLEYTGEFEYVIVSDGSTDATDRILESYAGDSRFRVVTATVSRGKASGLNEALRLCTGDIVLFTDARQHIERGAVRLLIENFADPSVGCASGELMLGDQSDGETGKGMGLYWRIEKKIRELESCCGSVVGATGAFYAARREFVPQLPAGTILDDVLIPMSIARQGKRVIFDSRARAWDSPDLGGKREFSRKVRTLTGNYQLLQLAPWLLSGGNPLRFEFVSHKLMRLLVPVAMLALFISSALLPGKIFAAVFWAQVAGYTLSVLALTKIPMGPLARIADPASTLVVLNAAALVALGNFLTGRTANWNPMAPASTAVVGAEKEVRL